MTISSTPMPPSLPLTFRDPPGLRWFSASGCLVRRDDRTDAFVGGTLIGSFTPEDRAARNVLLVGLAEDPRAHLGRLARAFDLSEETVRVLRRARESEGLAALVVRSPPGAKSKVTPALRRKLEALFEAGRSVTSVHEEVRGRHRVSHSTVGNVRAAWGRARLESTTQTPEQQLDLPAAAGADETDRREVAAPSPVAPRRSDGAPVAGARRAEQVQHVGSWLLLGALQSLGLHQRALVLAERRGGADDARLAIDAVTIALALGEGCVEGVRRIATPSAATLLRCSGAPSPAWTRRVLGRLAADAGGALLHLAMAKQYVIAAQAEARGGAVFYVDNHMRTYTGQHVLRRGWRMQDKRVRPGTSDYYVHDVAGRPVFRMNAPHHGSLTDFLSPIARVLRAALGPEEKILLAFDRAGAFPEQLAALRDDGFEFVTYERRPYPTLLPGSFSGSLMLDGESHELSDSRTNLGKGRGRVRRLAVRGPDGRQVNLLATGERPAAEFVEIMSGRWKQENGFKYGERWGFNQLDGRTVEPYAPETMVPNPARRRLDHALRIARVLEGDGRSKLARLGADDERREQVELEIKQAVAEQEQLSALRPTTPKHAPLAETELAGKLVRHPPEYKLLMDTIRIACANAESELATELAEQLPRAAEAKQTLANLLAAPGRVKIKGDELLVALQPAGTTAERAAFTRFLRSVNRRRLTLPGDSRARRLRFSLAPE